jgi:isoquinoline 1-oxidoreductase alpha subunit
MAINVEVNGKPFSIEADPNTPLLWVIREEIGLTGTKFGCDIGACGACSVHVDGEVARSCRIPVAFVTGKSITTIEGIAAPNGALHPVQQAWIDAQVPQCGYCQSGQIMQAASLLKGTPHPTDEQIDEAMAGNICRCGTYQRIRQAIKLAAGKTA